MRQLNRALAPYLRVFMDIEFRQAKKADLPAVREIMSETWRLDDDVDDRGSLDYYQDAYFYSYLANSNYCEVAVAGGRVVGFLLGRCDSLRRMRGYLRYIFRYNLARIHLLLRPGGREGLDIINKTVHVDKKLLRDHYDEFDGELCLFAVADTHRKHGIGQRLLAHFHDFMRANGVGSYYLYTDTYCDIKFYEQNGFELVSLDTVDFGEDEENGADAEEGGASDAGNDCDNESDARPLPKYMLYKYNLHKKRNTGNRGDAISEK